MFPRSFFAPPHARFLATWHHAPQIVFVPAKFKSFMVLLPVFVSTVATLLQWAKDYDSVNERPSVSLASSSVTVNRRAVVASDFKSLARVRIKVPD